MRMPQPSIANSSIGTTQRARDIPVLLASAGWARSRHNRIVVPIQGHVPLRECVCGSGCVPVGLMDGRMDVMMVTTTTTTTTQLPESLLRGRGLKSCPKVPQHHSELQAKVGSFCLICPFPCLYICGGWCCEADYPSRATTTIFKTHVWVI